MPKWYIYLPIDLMRNYGNIKHLLFAQKWNKWQISINLCLEIIFKMVLMPTLYNLYFNNDYNSKYNEYNVAYQALRKNQREQTYVICMFFRRL